MHAQRLADDCPDPIPGDTGTSPGGTGASPEEPAHSPGGPDHGPVGPHPNPSPRRPHDVSVDSQFACDELFEVLNHSYYYKFNEAACACFFTWT